MLNACYDMINEMAPVMKCLRDIKITPNKACEAEHLSDAEHARLADLQGPVDQVVAVDDFSPQELGRYFPAAAPQQKPKRREAAE